MDEHDFSDHVRIARVGRPHGIRGEVTVEVFTDSPLTRFQRGAVVRIKATGGSQPMHDTLTLEAARWNKKILLLKFSEFSDRNKAEDLRGAELYAPAQDETNGEGWYPDDLVGLPVHNGSFLSPRIGEVSDLVTGEVQDLLEIRLADGREALLPFVNEIVPEIHKERGVIITPPPGLLELNQD